MESIVNGYEVGSRRNYLQEINLKLVFYAETFNQLAKQNIEFIK